MFFRNLRNLNLRHSSTLTSISPPLNPKIKLDLIPTNQTYKSNTELTPHYSVKTNTAQYIFDLKLKNQLKDYLKNNPSANIPIYEKMESNINYIASSDKLNGFTRKEMNIYPTNLVLFEIYEIEIIGTLIDGSGFGLIPVNLPTSIEPELWIMVVPTSLPGEIIKAKFSRYGKCPGYVYAQIIENTGVGQKDGSLIQHNKRIKPFCKEYHECSSCQLQHIDYNDQLEWKHKSVVERFNDFNQRQRLSYSYPIQYIIQSPKTQNFRTKIGIHHGTIPVGKTVREIGFTSRYSKRIVDIDSCPIATETINKHLPEVRSKIQRSAIPTNKPIPAATHVLSHSSDPTPEKRKEITNSTNSYTKMDSVHQEWPEKGWTPKIITDQNSVVTTSINGRVIRYSAGSFFQTNASIIPHLITYISTQIETLTKEGHQINHLVDAYCGSGLFSILLPVKSALGIDSDPRLVRWAEVNSRVNSLQHRYFKGDAAQLLKQVCTAQSFSPNETCVIMDPPSKGSSQEFLDQVIEFLPAVIIYVSCCIKTQVRDLGVLVKDYDISCVQPFDMFPHSFHIENVVTLKLKKNGLK